ncbi:Multiple epidermal growth factor-like domains protein 8 [Actinomortierella ambigua]|nr:Multiple epidermal growth factor-like domains protein 8 [Actinomortierella ambigua]
MRVTMDYLTLYDGDNTGAPVIAKLCGNIWQSRTQTFYSSGATMTAVLTISADSPGGHGFTAQWSTVDRCDVCLGAGTGTCNNFKCQCINKRDGPVCERETAGSKDFRPRSQHSMAYDAHNDVVYITGGIDASGSILWDMVSYSFSSNKWSAISTNRAPRPRYGHCSFVHNENLYIFGGMYVTSSAEIWMYNGKTWTEQQPINRDSQPRGTVGSACVLVTNANVTMLYVFGGTDKDGQISRELTTYNFESGSWAPASHRNAVPLTGASGVYHKATNSIYFFGGTTNQTARNVIIYQYAIQEALWYALPPRVDPFTYNPVPPAAAVGSLGGPSLAPTPIDDDNDEDNPEGTITEISTYQPPVMYDSVSAVWAPAGLAGDDYIVMFGGTIPYGPGVKLRDPGQRCYTPTLVVYDINCQNWTTHDIYSPGPLLRANHTMLIRPPGSAGSSKTNWTALIFGGFDGQDHNDIVNITIPLGDQNAGLINSCRALRWCSMYDDCMYCNRKPYCSFVDGLCLFDTEKARSGPYIAGSSADEPRTGTLQDLIQQQPALMGQVKQQKNSCEVPRDVPLRSFFQDIINPGQTIKFSTYIDDPESDILFMIGPPSPPLEFKTLNVWEGFMNMYWRADHGLTDNTWDGNSSTSSPWPPDYIKSSLDGPVITAAGTLNTSQLYSRWSRYSGLDSSISMSAIRSNESQIRFYANDPRRFSGYYVYSLTNHHDTQISFSIQVMSLEHSPPTVNEKGNGFNMTMLAFFMAGFILAVILLVLLARKIRRLIEERDQSHQAADMLGAAGDDDDDLNGGQGEGGRGGATAIEMNGLRLRKKPLYRVVVGVQDYAQAGKGHGEKTSSLRQRKRASLATFNEDSLTQLVSPIRRSTSTSTRPAHRKSLVQAGRTQMEHAFSFEQLPISDDGHVEGLAVRNAGDNQDPAKEEKTSVVGMLSRSLSRRLSRNSPPRREDESGIAPEDRPMQLAHDASSSGWSLNPVGRVTSLRRTREEHRVRKEEREGLTGSGEDKEEYEARGNSSESDRGVVDLDQLSKTPQHRSAPTRPNDLPSLYSRRNPARVQPISIEPIPFHGGLVPRTRANLQRYQRHLQRQQAYEERLRRVASPPSIVSTTTTTAGRITRRPQPSPGLQRSATSQSSTSSLHGLRHSLSRTLLRSRVNASAANNIGSREEGSRVSFDTSTDDVTNPAAAAGSTTSVVDKDEKVRRLRQVKSSDSLHKVRRAASIMSRRNYPVARHDSSRSTSALATPLSGAGTKEFVDAGLSGVPPGDKAGEEATAEMSELSRVSYTTEAKNNPYIHPPSRAGVERVRIPRKTEQGRELAILRHSPSKKEQEFEPGPLVAVNILIVFPGDEGSRRVMPQGELVARQRAKRNQKLQQQPHQQQQQQQLSSGIDDTLYDSERRLPPMAIGTTFLPDPVRWWAHRAYQHKDQRRQARQVQKTL